MATSRKRLPLILTMASHFQLARAYRLAGMSQEAQNENAIYERMDKESHAAQERKLPPATIGLARSLESGET